MKMNLILGLLQQQKMRQPQLLLKSQRAQPMELSLQILQVVTHIVLPQTSMAAIASSTEPMPRRKISTQLRERQP